MRDRWRMLTAHYPRSGHGQTRHDRSPEQCTQGFKTASLGLADLEDEPNGIGNWRDDMVLATSALDEWVQVAVSWQISEATTATLTAASAKVTAAFKVAQADIADTVAGK